MLNKFIKGKVYVFIDAENLFYSQRTLGWKIAYEKLMKYLKQECGEDIKCFVYSGLDENNTKQRKFLDMLEINGFIVRTKIVKKINIGHNKYKWKSNLDIELALEMIRLKDKYDTVILMSGDSDFATPIDELKYERKNVIILSTRGRIARELLVRGRYLDIRKLKDELSQ